MFTILNERKCVRNGKNKKYKPINTIKFFILNVNLPFNTKFLY